MDYKVTNDSSFNGKIFKVNYKGQDFFIGIANLREGCDIYYPQAGSGSILVMLNTSIYRFPFTEFTWPFRDIYLCEKMHCSKEEAELVYNVVREELYKDAAQALLMGETNNNPFIKE